MARQQPEPRTGPELLKLLKSSDVAKTEGDGEGSSQVGMVLPPATEESGGQTSHSPDFPTWNSKRRR